MLYNGSSREPRRLTGATTSPHGSLGDSQVVSSRETRHRAHPQRCSLCRRPAIPIPSSVYWFIYALVYVCAYNGSSREPGRLTRVTTSPHGSHDNSLVVSLRSFDVGRPAAPQPPLLTRYTCTVSVYTHFTLSHMCVYISALHGSHDVSDEKPSAQPSRRKGMRRRVLTGPSGPASESRFPRGGFSDS